MSYRNQWRLGALSALFLGSLCSAPLSYAQFVGPALTPAGQRAGATETAATSEPAEMRILPGDIIDVQVLGAPELNTLMEATAKDLHGANAPLVGMRVGPRGEVAIPYAGTIVVGGLTPGEAAEAIGRVLKEKGILVDPNVTVRLADSPTRMITVIGEVKNPSPIPALGNVRLLDAVSACGGFTNLASHTITVRRIGQSEPLRIELGTDPLSPEIGNIALVAGDTVVVPTVGNAYVMGEVKNQQPITLAGNNPVTVLRAITMAGGLKYSAALSRARVIRPVGGNRQVQIVFDLDKVRNGKQQDIALAANDILYIPASTFKSIISSGGAAIAASLLYGSVYAVTNLK